MKKPRKRPSQRRSRDTVDFILEGAARVFDREGINATTNRIAEEAGVSVGSVYQYFPDKYALLVELAERHLDESEQTLRDALDAEASDVRAFTENLVRVAAQLHEQRGELHKLMRVHAARSPQTRARFTDLMRWIVGRIEKELGDLGIEDAVGRAQIIASTVDAHVHGILAGGPGETVREQRIRLVVNQVMTLIGEADR